MTLCPRKDSWTAGEDAALAAVWPRGAAPARAAVNAAGRIGRSLTACARRVSTLRRRGVKIAGRGPVARGIAGSETRDAKAAARAAASDMRQCLRCHKDFASEGPGNRVCGECKKSSAWRGGAAQGALNASFGSGAPFAIDDGCHRKLGKAGAP